MVTGSLIAWRLQILDAAGKYSLSQLEKYDPAWFELCSHGIKWEILSWVMDVEEPEAALVISIISLE